MGCGVSNDRVLRIKENARPSLVCLTLVPTLRSEGRGTAKELTRGLLGGVPHPGSKRGADICVPEGSEARPASGHGVGVWWLLCLFLGPLPGKFLVKAPSLAWLIRGKRGLVCACVEGSVQTQGQGSSEQIVSPCPLDGFLDPLLSLLPQAHHRGLGRWGRCAEVRYPSVYKGAWGWVRGSFPSLRAPPEHRQKSEERQSPVEGHRGLE